MLKAIFKALSEAVSGILNLAEFLANKSLEVAMMPFWAIGRGANANMPPKFEPAVTGDELLAGLQTKREQAVSASVSKDGVSTIYRFAKATPPQRATIDLSALPSGVRETLLLMSDAELEVLSTAGQHAVRQFANGREHGIFGLPKVDPNAAPLFAPQREVVETPGNAILREMQTRILREMKKKDGALHFKMPIPRG